MFITTTGKEEEREQKFQNRLKMAHRKKTQRTWEKLGIKDTSRGSWPKKNHSSSAKTGGKL